MENYVFINDKYILKNEACISLDDPGFLYGDGLFETIRSYNGNIFMLDEHVKRLFNSLTVLKYNLSEKICNYSYIKSCVEKLLGKNKLTNCDSNIKIIVSRGIYEARLDVRTAAQSNLIITAQKLNPYPDIFYSKGVDLVISSIKRVSHSNPLYRHKLLNYFENIYAKNEANCANAFDSIFLTSGNFILEGAISNFFIVKNNTVLTPSLNQNILPGITRDLIIKLCKENKIKIKETGIKYDNNFNCEEMFVTNTIAEILPVKRIDNFEIKNEIPGRITNILINLYRQKTIKV